MEQSEEIVIVENIKKQTKNKNKKTTLVALSIALATIILLFGIANFDSIFKNDNRTVNKFLDKKETVVYKDYYTGIHYDTYFFDKNNEIGIGRLSKDSDIFYIVKEGEIEVYNYRLDRDEKYHYITSTCFEWGGFLDDTTVVHFILTDSRGVACGYVDFKDFTVDKGLQRVYNDYGIDESPSNVEYFAEITNYNCSRMVLNAKAELAELIKSSISFVKQNDLPYLIQWE